MVIDAIDGMFRNSPAETKTTTEKAFVLGFISMLGNIQMIIGSIAGVVVFTMLLVAVSTMATTVRERMREVAILKAVGYSRNLVLALVMAEALFISLVGAGLGICLGESLRLIDLDRITQGFIQKFDPGFSTYAAVVAAGIVIGLVSGFIPARQAANMSITTAMRRME
jgi:putative ABC transport system permease protein